ncbi:TMV resistance protein N [Trifolium repens]|nr:TMV resistance protein N [Trifolium repens]
MSVQPEILPSLPCCRLCAITFESVRSSIFINPRRRASLKPSYKPHNSAMYADVSPRPLTIPSNQIPLSFRMAAPHPALCALVFVAPSEFKAYHP